MSEEEVKESRPPELAETAVEDSERNQIALRLAAIPNIADPERIQSSSMSDRSPVHIEGPEITSLSKPNDFPLYSTESERVNSPLDLQSPKRSNSPAPVEVSSPRSRFETTDILPLNGENPETGNSSKTIPETGNSPKFIQDNSPNGHMSVPSDLIGNIPVSESVRDEQHHPESILDRQDNLTSLSDSSDPPESVFDITENLESVLDGLDYPEIVPEEPDYPQPISKEPDSLEHISDGQNFPNAIPDVQSRSESIKSHETVKGRDQQPQVRREAKLHRFRWRSLKTRARVSEKRTELRQARSEMS